eukprot:scaffold76280_cov42-Phaeocystis_antarctica.AAC.2
MVAGQLSRARKPRGWLRRGVAGSQRSAGWAVTAQDGGGRPWPKAARPERDAAAPGLAWSSPVEWKVSNKRATGARTRGAECPNK